MSTPEGSKFERTDMWREGKWLDLWSIVHVISGISMAFGLYLLHFGAFASVALALLSLISYEMWEAMVRIEETPTNRFMDVVVGMTGFLPVFFLFAPRLSEVSLIFTFGLVLTANVAMSIFGWRASQKSVALQKRVRARYATQRERILKQRAMLRERFRR